MADKVEKFQVHRKDENLLQVGVNEDDIAYLEVNGIPYPVRSIEPILGSVAIPNGEQAVNVLLPGCTTTSKIFAVVDKTSLPPGVTQWVAMVEAKAGSFDIYKNDALFSISPAINTVINYMVYL